MIVSWYLYFEIPLTVAVSPSPFLFSEDDYHDKGSTILEFTEIAGKADRAPWQPIGLGTALKQANEGLL